MTEIAGNLKILRNLDAYDFALIAGVLIFA